MEKQKDDLPEKFSLHYLAQWLCGENTDDQITSEDASGTKRHLAYLIENERLTAWYKNEVFPPVAHSMGSTPYDSGTDYHKIIMEKAMEITVNRDDFLTLILPKCEYESRCRFEDWDECNIYGDCKRLEQGEKYEKSMCALNECPPFVNCKNREIRDLLAQYNIRISTEVPKPEKTGWVNKLKKNVRDNWKRIIGVIVLLAVIAIWLSYPELEKTGWVHALKIFWLVHWKWIIPVMISVATLVVVAKK